MQLDGKTEIPDGIKLADYLFFNGRAVAELKTLKSDPEGKIQEISEKLMQRNDFPRIIGQFDLEDAVRQLPDGDRVIKDLFLKATRQIEDLIRKANKQIISTKKYLNLPAETPGIVVIVNEKLHSIPPDAIKDRISQVLSMKDNSKNHRFNNIDVVLLIQHQYKVTNTNIEKLIPIYIIENDNGGNSKFLNIQNDIDGLVRDWCNFNGYNHVIQDDMKNIKLKLEPAEKKVEAAPQCRQEVIEHQYRQNRYLYHMNEAQIIAYGSELYQIYLPNFIKGEKKLPEENILKLTKLMIEFHEETRLRCFDMSKLKF